MARITVGVDVGKASHRAAAHDPATDRVLGQLSFDVDRAGGLVLRYAREQLVGPTREHLERVIARWGGARPVPADVLAEYTVGAPLGVLTWWLDNGTPLPAREMAATFERLTAPALQAGLGIGAAAPIVEQPT